MAPVPFTWLSLVGALDQADPDLITAYGEVAAQQALVDQARARPNPELELEVSDIALREGDDPVDPRLRAAYSIEQPASGLISRRVALAELEVRRAEADLALVRQERLHALLPDWIEVSRLAGALGLATESAARLTDSVVLTQQLVDEGEVPGADLRRLQVESGIAESSRAEVARELIAARGLLALHLGLPPESAVTPPLAELFPAGSGEVLETWQTLALAHRPDLLRDRTELDRLALEQAVAEAEGRSNPSYSVFLESTVDETVAGAGLTIPLKGHGNGTRGTQESIGHRREALQTTITVREQQITTEVAVRYASAEAAEAQVSQLESAVLPAAEAALNAARLAWQEGEGSLLNYLDAERQRLALGETLLDAQAALAEARGELLLATGLTTRPEETHP
ncbi:MAG: TolC family protein [bacterium]